MEIEQAAGFDGLPELGVLDRHEIDQLAAPRFALVFFDQRLQRQYPRRLRQRLDLEDAGHDRPTGEMTLEKLLVHRHALDRVNRFVGLVRNHPIDEQQGVAMGQQVENSANVDAIRAPGGRAFALTARHVGSQRPCGCVAAGCCCCCWPC